MTPRIETKWVLCAGFEPAKGHTEPQPVEAWQDALDNGWEPAGPSLTVPVRGGLMVFAMVQRSVNRLALFGVSDEVPIG